MGVGKTVTDFQNKHFLLRTLAPAQRAAGGCSPPKVTPGREPAAGDFFFILTSVYKKINAFLLFSSH